MNPTPSNPTPGQMPQPVPTTSNSKPLWAAVGTLGVAVLALGGTMLYQGRPAAPVTPVVAVTAPAGVTKLALNSPAGSSNAADDLIEKPAVAPAKPAPAPVKKVVQAPKPAPALTYSNANGGPAYSATPAQRVCAACGTVESVTPVQRSTKAEAPAWVLLQAVCWVPCWATRLATATVVLRPPCWARWAAALPATRLKAI